MDKMIPGFFFDPDKLAASAKAQHAAYRSAEPFPHIVLDDFFPEDILNHIAEDFPDPAKTDWIRYQDTKQVKLESKKDQQMSPLTRHFLSQLNSADFLQYLESLTGIQGLIPDPYFFGGGLHQINKGGFLKIHADFNHYWKLKLCRRINLLIYLNHDWKEEYGGHLELWDRKMQACHHKVLPTFNRSVIFNTTDFANHGHPDPLNCPEDRSRKSLALYYYTNGRPSKEASLFSHSTLFKKRPQDTWQEENKLSTTFKNLPGLLKTVAIKITPPFLTDFIRSLKDRAS